jgi:hypothetical protein
MVEQAGLAVPLVLAMRAVPVELVDRAAAEQAEQAVEVSSPLSLAYLHLEWR